MAIFEIMVQFIKVRGLGVSARNTGDQSDIEFCLGIIFNVSHKNALHRNLQASQRIRM